jgi:hypothetical protein
MGPLKIVGPLTNPSADVRRSGMPLMMTIELTLEFAFRLIPIPALIRSPDPICAVPEKAVP